MAAVVVVLGHGALTRGVTARSPRPEVGPPAPEPRPLRPDLDKFPLTYQEDYWRQVAGRARAKLALVGPARHPAVAVAPGLVVAAAAAADGPPPPSPAGEGAGGGGFRLLAVDPDVGLSVFEVRPPGAVPAFRPADVGAAQPGSLIAAVSLAPDDQLRVAPGHLVSGRPAGDPDSLDVSIRFPRALGAAAVVDLDGGLLGVVVESSRGARVLSVDGVTRVVERLREGPPCRSIEVGDLDEGARRLLGLEGGALIERVRGGSFESPPTVRPGDVVTSWGRRPIGSAGELVALYDAEPPGRAVEVRVRRGRRSLGAGWVMPARDCRPFGSAPIDYPGLGLSVVRTGGPRGAGGPAEGTDPAWRVARVAAGGRAAAAGLAEGDWVVAVDGRELAGAGALRALARLEAAGSTPALLTVRRGERTRLLALPPPRSGVADGR